MLRNKLVTILCMLVTFIVLQLPAFSRCSTKQLQKTCDSCAQQAVNNLDLTEVCPTCSVCPVCPTASGGAFVSKLKNRYRLTTKLFANVTDVYQINIINNKNTYGFITADVTHLGSGIQVLNGYVFLDYDAVVFVLPRVNQTSLEFYPDNTVACVGYLKDDSSVEGTCLGTFKDNLNNLSPSSTTFTAVPN